MALTVEQAAKVVTDFLASYNGNITVGVRIGEKQEDIYGSQNSREIRREKIDGGYSPRSHVFAIAASNLDSEADARRLCRHELLGHYGLNTFKPSEKLALLDAVLETRQSPSLDHVWRWVDKHYPNFAAEPLKQAEEVFAFVAEEERSFVQKSWDKVCATLDKALRATGLTDQPLTIHQLRVEAQQIAKGIREGVRLQQTFPSSDQAQFRIQETNIMATENTQDQTLEQAKQADYLADVGWYADNNNWGARMDLIGDALFRNGWEPDGRSGYTKVLDAADGVVTVHAALRQDDARYLEARIAGATSGVLFDADMRGMGPQSTKWLVQGFEAGIQERANVLPVAAMQEANEVDIKTKTIASWTVARAAQEVSKNLDELEAQQPQVDDLTYYARRSLLLETMLLNAENNGAYAAVLIGLRPNLDLYVALESIKGQVVIEKTWNLAPHLMYRDEFAELVDALDVFGDPEGSGAFEIIDKKVGFKLGFSNANTPEKAITDVHKKLISDALFAIQQNKPLQLGEPLPAMPRFDVIAGHYELLDAYSSLIESKYPVRAEQQRLKENKAMMGKERRKGSILDDDVAPATVSNVRESHSTIFTNKAPHEMMREEFAQHVDAHPLPETHGRKFEVVALYADISYGFSDAVTSELAVADVHKREVSNALLAYLDGEGVKYKPPVEVLSQYLDLLAEYEAAFLKSRVLEQPEPKKPTLPRDLRQELTDKFVAALDQGKIPWAKPWETMHYGVARNMATDRDYGGGNKLMLALVQMDRGYADPRFGTMKQINDLGGRVNSGEKGFPIEVWKERPFWERKDVSVYQNEKYVKVVGEVKENGQRFALVKDAPFAKDGKPISTGLLVVRHTVQGVSGATNLGWDQAHKKLDTVGSKVYTVFNVEQCKDLKIEPLKLPAQHQTIPLKRVEAIEAAMRADGLKFGRHPQHAYYSPRRDEVVVPPPASFPTPEQHAGTVLHEIGHATGAANRLNREGITGGHKFGSIAYAKEELRAEMFSAFMAAQTGVAHDFGNHVAYVQSWSETLKNDKNEIFKAAAEAGKAVDYVLGKEQELLKSRDQQQTNTAQFARGNTVVQMSAGDNSIQIGAIAGNVNFGKDESPSKVTHLDVARWRATDKKAGNNKGMER
ncbi:MAG: hypothetical protein RLY95_35 [Pseudomonadota bacterium]|jgi:antirestriction protein ArdC